METNINFQYSAFLKKVYVLPSRISFHNFITSLFMLRILPFCLLKIPLEKRPVWDASTPECGSGTLVDTKQRPCVQCPTTINTLMSFL